MDDIAFGGPEIVTEGGGWYEQQGDRAELDVGFTATARSRADAVRELGRRVAAAEPALTRSGLEVRHRRFGVHNEWRGNRVVGCRAQESIELLFTDVTALDAVLTALIGAEPTDLSGPRWLLADPAEALREAQRRAVADARRRAEGYAAALGGRLGPLRRLSEAPDHDRPVMYARASMDMSGAPDVRELGLEPETVRISCRCTTSWTLITQEGPEQLHP